MVTHTRLRIFIVFFLLLLLGAVVMHNVQASSKINLAEKLEQQGIPDIQEIKSGSVAEIIEEKDKPFYESFIPDVVRNLQLFEEKTEPVPEPSPELSITPEISPIAASDSAEMVASPSAVPTVEPTLEPTVLPSSTPLPEKPSVQSQQVDVTVFTQEKPDVLVSVNTSTIQNEEIEVLLSAIQNIQDEDKDIAYYESERLQKLYLYLYDSSDQMAELKQDVQDIQSVVVGENRVYKAQFTPDDTYYGQQWNLTNIDYSGAMDFGSGSATPIIAVMDNGVNTSDPELTNKLWVNTGETANNGIDDDSNGYIDDVHGCNFPRYGTSPSTACRDASLYTSGTNHGTTVANIIAGETNNSFGTAGVCANCKIMVLDIDDTGGAALSDIFEAIDYAVDNGAHVVNFSYGSSCPFDASQDILYSTINTLINTNSVSFVQSAGNQGATTEQQCVANCGNNVYCTSSFRNDSYYYVDGKTVPNKITVASLNQSNQRSSFSNYNDNAHSAVTIAAPGEGVKVMVNGSLSTVSGTSFAAPHVSGALGLSLSRILANRAQDTAELATLVTNTGTEITTDKNVSGKALNLNKLYTVTVGREVAYGTQLAALSRFYSTANTTHFFTSNELEGEQIRDDFIDSDMKYEGIAYFVYKSNVTNSTAVYRFISQKLGIHFYTADPLERDQIIADYPEDVWRYEGIAFYVYPLGYGGSSRTVYRFWSPRLSRHFFTAEISERDYLIENRSDTYDYEGPAWKIPN